MKIVIQILTTLLILQCIQSKLNPTYNYEQFLQQFGINYQKQQKQFHRKIFNENYAKLRQRQQLGYDVGVNRFLDWSQAELQSFFSSRQPTIQIKSEPQQNIQQNKLLASQIQNSIKKWDWRQYKIVSPVKDQNHCGNCWAFASTAHYESLLAMQSNGTYLYDLSQQYATQCQTISQGCNGGWVQNALALISISGIPSQLAYPYRSSPNYYKAKGQPICDVNSSKNIKLKSAVKSINIYQNLTTQQIEKYLIKFGPFAVGVYANNDAFLTVGKTGLIQDCPADPSNDTSSPYYDHNPLLIGFNETHWFVKNSWGTGWGDYGFGYVLKTNDCNLAKWVYIAQVDFNYQNNNNNNNNNNIVNQNGQTTIGIIMRGITCNGWQGNILGLKQGQNLIAKIQKLPRINSLQYQLINISSQINTQIVIYKYGNKTQQLSYTISRLDGTILSYRLAGNTFNYNVIFDTFCIYFDNCVVLPLKVYLSVFDANGICKWDNTILTFIQNDNKIIVNGTNYINNKNNKNKQIIQLQFLPYDNVTIELQEKGQRISQIGLVLNSYQGYQLYRANIGDLVSESKIVGNFTIKSINHSPVIAAPVAQVTNQATVNQNTNQANTTTTSTTTVSNSKNVLQKLIIAFAAVLIVLIIGIIVLTAKYVKFYGINMQQGKYSKINSNLLAKDSKIQVNKNN